jgi:MFS family permease
MADTMMARATGSPDQAGAGKWWILILLSVGVLIAYADRASLSAALANKSFVHAFAMNDIDRGWLGSAIFWSYALLQLPMGWTVDRYGVKWPYAISFALWCLATAAAGLSTSFAALFVMRFIVGGAEAAVMPASYRWMREHLPERHMGSAIGIFTVGNKIGTAIGTPVAAWLIMRYDWRWMFLLTGGLGLVWLVPWLACVRNDFPARADRAAAIARAATVPFRNIIASPVVWGAVIGNFCYNYFTFYCMTWMPAYLVEQRGLSLGRSAIYTLFSFAGIAVVTVIAGWVADRMIERGSDAVRTRKAFVVAGYAGGSTVLLGAYATSLDWALFWNIFSLSCLGLASANNLALTKVTLVPAPAVGRVVGVQHVAAGLSGGVAASLSGWLLHVSGSYTLPMMAIVGFLALGALSTVIFLRPEWSPKVVGQQSPA